MSRSVSTSSIIRRQSSCSSTGNGSGSNARQFGFSGDATGWSSFTTTYSSLDGNSDTYTETTSDTQLLGTNGLISSSDTDPEVSAVGGQDMHAMQFVGSEIQPTVSGSSVVLGDGPGGVFTWASHPSAIGYRRAGGYHADGSYGSYITIVPVAPEFDSGMNIGTDGEEMERLVDFSQGAEENPTVAQSQPISRAQQQVSGIAEGAGMPGSSPGQGPVYTPFYNPETGHGHYNPFVGWLFGGGGGGAGDPQGGADTGTTPDQAAPLNSPGPGDLPNTDMNGNGPGTGPVPRPPSDEDDDDDEDPDDEADGPASAAATAVAAGALAAAQQPATQVGPAGSAGADDSATSDIEAGAVGDYYDGVFENFLQGGDGVDPTTLLAIGDSWAAVPRCMACHGTGVSTGQTKVWDRPANYQWSIMQATNTANPRDAQMVVDAMRGTVARFNGGIRAAGGLLTVPVAAGMSSTGLGAIGGLAVGAWALDQAATGTNELIFEVPTTSIGGTVIQARAGNGTAGKLLTGAYDIGPGFYLAAKATRPAPSGPTPAVAPTAGTRPNINPSYPGPGRTQNCVNCATATESTFAGRPANALPSARPRPLALLEQFYGGMFARVADQAAIETQMALLGPGARGIVYGSRPDGTAHVFNVVVNQRGVVKFFDGQSGTAGSFGGYNQLRLLITNAP
jgi:hypothetical protein